MNCDAIGPKQVVTTSEPCADGDSAHQVEGAAPLLERPVDRVLAGDLVTQMALLMERSLQKQRSAFETRRDAAERSQERAEDGQVEKMREAARETFAQAMVSCAMSVAASAAQAVAGGLQICSAELAHSATTAPTTKWGAWLSNRSQMATACSKLADAAGTGINGTSTAISGAMNAEMKNTEADAKVQEQLAGRAGRRAQRDTDSMREMQEMADKTMQRLEQLLESRHQTRLALIQRM